MTHLVQQDITANQIVKVVHLTFKNGLLGAPPHLKILVSKLSENVTLKIPLCSSLTTPLLLPFLNIRDLLMVYLSWSVAL